MYLKTDINKNDGSLGPDRGLGSWHQAHDANREQPRCLSPSLAACRRAALGTLLISLQARGTREQRPPAPGTLPQHTCHNQSQAILATAPAAQHTQLATACHLVALTAQVRRRRGRRELRRAAQRLPASRGIFMSPPRRFQEMHARGPDSPYPRPQRACRPRRRRGAHGPAPPALANKCAAVLLCPGFLLPGLRACSRDTPAASWGAASASACGTLLDRDIYTMP